MTTLAVAAGAPAPAAAAPSAAAAGRPHPRTDAGCRPATTAQPMRHLSHSSYTRSCCARRTGAATTSRASASPPSGAMFLGARVDDALTAYYRRIIEHGDTLTLDQVKDLYRDHWTEQLDAEQAKRGVDWEHELTQAGRVPASASTRSS